MNIAKQAQAKGISVFMKESLLAIVEENMMQEFPASWKC